VVERAPVVIAGAGPNGLMLARELALAGVKCVVLEAVSRPSAEPKANGLVGQVIRMLDMRGLYRVFTDDDQPPQPSNGWTFSGMPMSFAAVADNPMYAMLMPQPRLVRLLAQQADELGIDVRWGHPVVAVDPNTDGVHLTVNGPDGRYTLHTRYLVAADGGRSFVRKSLGIAFPGSTAPTVGRLAHVRIPPDLRAADGSMTIPGGGRLPFGHNRFDQGMVIYAPFEPERALLGTLEYGLTSDDAPMTIGELQTSLRRVIGADIPLEPPAGPGPHALRRINGQNSRQVECYRVGPVLLLGDAAHVHSAMGGPGLNLGLADAFNLGWKLAAEVNGTAPAGLLDTFHSERHPVGGRVMMHSMAQTALMAPGPEVAALRALFAELLEKDQVATQMARLLAGADIRYDVGCDHPLAGYFMPDLRLDDGRRSADLLHTARPVLVDFTAALRTRHPRVDYVSARMTEAPAAAMLIRPDGYIAWAASDIGPGELDGLAAAQHRFFGD